METVSFPRPFTSSVFPRTYARPFLSSRRGKAVVSTSEGDDVNGDGLVDENLVVLRRRIRGTRMAGTRHEAPPPHHWMEWEKQYYESYGSDVCQVMDLLQVTLMNTRPSLGIGVVALAMLSVPTSVILVLFHVLGWIGCMST